MKVAMLTTTGERCGIASYTRALIEGLRGLPDTEVEIIPIKEGRQPPSHYREQAEIANAPDIDVVHIQHEHSFWGGILPKSSGYWELRYLIKKPVVLTAHTTYSLAQMLRLDTERRPHKWLAKQMLLRNAPNANEIGKNIRRIGGVSQAAAGARLNIIVQNIPVEPALSCSLALAPERAHTFPTKRTSEQVQRWQLMGT